MWGSLWSFAVYGQPETEACIADWVTLLRANRTKNPHKPEGFFGLFSILVCDVLPLIINNPDVRLPASLLYKYLNKAAEFYINYVTRSTQTESQYQGKNIFTKLTFLGMYIGITEVTSINDEYITLCNVSCSQV